MYVSARKTITLRKQKLTDTYQQVSSTRFWGSNSGHRLVRARKLIRLEQDCKQGERLNLASGVFGLIVNTGELVDQYAKGMVTRLLMQGPQLTSLRGTFSASNLRSSLNRSRLEVLWR